MWISFYYNIYFYKIQNFNIYDFALEDLDVNANIHDIIAIKH